MKVAVIGAGTSGLTSIKCCLDENLEPVCFERSDDIGGVWRYSQHVENGRASIYESVFSNTSKEMMNYSDFPIPENFPNFLHNSKMLEYYRMYAEEFNLLKYIKFKTLVLSVRKHPNFQNTGQWEVITEKDGEEETSTFDFVMVCNGHHSDPYYPLDAFPSIKEFKGTYLHSREYKTPDVYKGKRVLIIGMGNTGCDIAVELSRTADRVFLSTRRGSWVLSRVYDNGYPWDICYDTRYKTWLRNTLPSGIVKWQSERKMNEWFDHVIYGVQPSDSSQFKEPLCNDELPSCITRGSVVIKPNVTEFTDTSVKFEDGTSEKNIDIVIFATGFALSFPFLEGSIIKEENPINCLYRNIFPTSLEKPTLGIIGLIQPLGPIMSAAEVQARWVTRVFKGLCIFPSQEQIMKDIAKKKEILKKSFGTARDNTLRMDYIEYMDELASDIGIKPNMLGLFLTDPNLALMVLFGPCIPAQYRLTGPGKWPHARKHIMATWDRVTKTTQTRIVKKHDNSLVMGILLPVLCVLALLLATFIYQK
ncbi:hypothetical protein GDO86_007667 [Hymenochirus boettgeri]|uniref:Flavin-containing monooxygenase n=1 Tax=Hymenochirus boettgeri TaxID=247094 RepID=A0A8T2J2Q8_9PIPI|nr:hypothetical protein GDO86_007667 [Hymenochirus boettgeri]